MFRADHPPYGSDFPGHILTGRFSNGKLITVFFVSSQGIKDFLPPFLDPTLTGNDLVTGVSFASAGSGFDELTSASTRVLSIAEQVGSFRTYIIWLKQAVGKEKADRIMQDAVFVIASGSNDMIMNFYITPRRRATFSLPRYHGFLLQKLEALVQQIYNMGVRKFTITGLPPIGCLPFQITMANMYVPGAPFKQRVCIESQNNDAIAYNSMLQALIRRMQTSFSGIKVAYVDIYNTLMEMIDNPKNFGFEETTRGCCGAGLMEMGPTCTFPFPTCPDPSKFLFWDSFHPSEAAYRALADQFHKTVHPQIIN